MERLDRLTATLAARIDETAGLIQQAIAAPARESLALLRALKVAVATFRAAAARRARPPIPREEPEEALFIG